MKKLTFEEYKDIKRYLRFHTIGSAARKFDRHLSTIINIKGSPNFIDYEELKKAEHPESVDTLADRVFELHKMTYMKPGITYFAPPTARTAVRELQLKQLKQLKLNKETKNGR